MGLNMGTFDLFANSMLVGCLWSGGAYDSLHKEFWVLDPNNYPPPDKDGGEVTLVFRPFPNQAEQAFLDRMRVEHPSWSIMVHCVSAKILAGGPHIPSVCPATKSK